jgi:tetraacyldisaccharide 4'-kinase
MSEPWFWRSEGKVAGAVRAGLAPAAGLYDALQRLRWRMTKAADPGVPVICVGNASVGGTGKTPFCLMLQRLLAEEGIEAQFLTRGYGGSLQGPVLVDAQHTAGEVGDEALLLARAAPTWIAKDRAKGAGAAAKAGATVLIMDDGFQNPGVKKTVSFLLLGGDEESLAQFPAGPLREPMARAMTRADGIVFPSPACGKGARGEEESRAPSPGFDAPSPPARRTHGPALQERERGEAARFTVRRDIAPSIPAQRVIAFCGLARPARFFGDLEAKGFTLAARIAYRDHHAYTGAEIASLRARAKAQNAALITTEKDLVRLAPEARAEIAVARLTLTVGDPAGLVRFVRERIDR